MPVKPHLLVHRISCRQCGAIRHIELRSDVWTPASACQRCGSQDQAVERRRGVLPVLLARAESLLRGPR